VGEQADQGTIETRSGTWAWKVRTLNSRSNRKPAGKALGFEDPANAINTMSVTLEPDHEQIKAKLVEQLSLAPRTRRFRGPSGMVWIAHPAGEAKNGDGKPVRQVSLHNLERDSRVVDLPPDRTLGDLKSDELAELVRLDR
jgi:hypothetical protein